MSRSRKSPYFTDQNTEAKRRANRIVRLAAKRECKNEDLPEVVADGKAYRKLSSTYDIRDWSFYCPNDKKASRK